MAYSWITFAQVKAQLAALLADTSNAYWSDAELGVYFVEAMRTFGSLTGFWSDRGTLTATAGQAFYDLPSLLNASGTYLRSYNVTDQQLVQEIEYHLLEPPTVPWTGTDQFTLADVTNSLERRRNQFLIETGAVVTLSTLAIPASPIGRVGLPDNVIALRRAEWNTPQGYISYLWNTDEYGAFSYNRFWNLEPDNPPYGWSMAIVSPLTLQLVPPPAENGQIKYLSVNTGAALNGSGVLMGIPDDFTWIAKFGALSDLLNKDGPARDPMRAQYAEQRYQEGIQIAKQAESTQQVRINDQVMYTDSLYEVDAARPNWQNQQQMPDNATMAGLNMLVLANVPDTTYGVSVDVVRNSVVPSANADFIQLGREEYDAVLGYAEHLACFKLGGAEFTASMPLYERFMRLAGKYNAVVNAVVRFQDPLTDRAQREESENPMSRAVA